MVSEERHAEEMDNPETAVEEVGQAPEPEPSPEPLLDPPAEPTPEEVLESARAAIFEPVTEPSPEPLLDQPAEPTQDEALESARAAIFEPVSEPILEPVEAKRPDTVAKEGEDHEEEEEEESEPDEGLQLREVPDDGIKRRWYAIHAHSGQEANVRRMLLISSEGLEQPHLVTNVLVPMEKVTELRSGNKRMAQHKFFPGYVLLQIPEHPEQYPELWQLIKNTPGVTGFIGSRTSPVPLEDEEVNAIVEVLRGERERPKPKVAFDEGERVKIIDGPFANFLGKIDEINAERGTMKVMVEIFERLTSIEVEFWQVELV